MRPEFNFRIAPISHKSENDNDIINFWHVVVIINIFWRGFVSLAKFSYWSKFHVNIITVSGVMTIFFYEKLTRHPKIGSTPSELCPISGHWDELGIPNSARMSLIKFYWILKNAWVTAFTVSELLRENHQRGR